MYETIAKPQCTNFRYFRVSKPKDAIFDSKLRISRTTDQREKSANHVRALEFDRIFLFTHEVVHFHR